MEIGLATTPGVTSFARPRFYGLFVRSGGVHYGVDYYLATRSAAINLQQRVALLQRAGDEFQGSSLVGEIIPLPIGWGPALRIDPIFALDSLQDCGCCNAACWGSGRSPSPVTWGGTTQDLRVEIKSSRGWTPTTSRCSKALARSACANIKSVAERSCRPAVR